ncbi:MAG: hypothetical protein ACYDCL_07580 [Myxococcales bacterium]
MPKRISIALALFAACGSSNNLPVQPQIAVDPTGLYFGTDICLGTCIGAAPDSSIQIINGGQNPLTLTSVTMAAPSVFTMSPPGLPLPDGGVQTGTPLTIPSQQEAFVRVIFAPQAFQKYLGTITIISNAQNADGGVTTVPLRGAGIPGCLPDGNFIAPPEDAGLTPDCTGDGGQTS